MNNEKKNKLDTTKRIAALLGTIVLVLLVIMTLVFAITDNPATMSYFMAAFALMIIIPGLIFGYQIVYRALKSLRDKNDNLNDSEK